MKLSVWYNTNQNKFYVSYNQTFSRFPSGYENEFSHIHIQSIFFEDDQVFYDLEAYYSYLTTKAERKPVSHRLGEQIEKIALWLKQR